MCSLLVVRCGIQADQGCTSGVLWWDPKKRIIWYWRLSGGQPDLYREVSPPNTVQKTGDTYYMTDLTIMWRSLDLIVFSNCF